MALMNDQDLKQFMPARIIQLGETYGDTNVKAAAIACSVIASSTALYHLGWQAYNWSSINGLWLCYKFVVFVCLPRNFSI